VNKIPPVDLARQYQLISEETGLAVLDVLRSGQYIGGGVVSEFERRFAEYVGVSHCVSCNSGTDALYLALRALGIGDRDEVITSTFTFIATSEAITLVGAKPVFVDIERSTFNLDLESLERALTPKTKAIIVVHLFGQPLNMTRLLDFAQAHGLYVIEDCAQATGASWQGQKVGSIGHIGCFSFFPTKNLGGCGDGGAITTSNTALAESMRMIKEHGSRIRYTHESLGINSRLDSIQAAILQVKLGYLDDWNKAREQIAQRYQELLAPLPYLELPQVIPGGQHVWNQYTILIPELESSPHRDQIRDSLQQQGILSMVYYPIPLHLQPVYQTLGYSKGSFPVSEQICHEVLSLPMFPDLTFGEQQRIAYSLKDCLVLNSSALLP